MPQESFQAVDTRLTRQRKKNVPFCFEYEFVSGVCAFQNVESRLCNEECVAASADRILSAAKMVHMLEVGSISNRNLVGFLQVFASKLAASVWPDNELVSRLLGVP